MDNNSAMALSGWLFNYYSGYIYGGYPPEPKDLLHEQEKFATFVQHHFSGVVDYSQHLLQLLAMTVS
jgi:hypothetical protein